VILSSDLCHVRCACLAGQIIVNKKSFVGFGRDRTGVARDLSLVWCVLCSLSLCLLLLPFSVAPLRYTSLHQRDSTEDSLQPKGIIYQFTIKRLDISIQIIKDKITTVYLFLKFKQHRSRFSSQQIE